MRRRNHMVRARINRGRRKIKLKRKYTMENETEGIKEIAEVVTFVAASFVGIKNAAVDGLGISDLGIIIGLSSSAKAAFEGIEKIPSELGDLSEQEADALVDMVNENLAGALGDRARQIVGKALAIVPKVVDLFEEIRQSDVQTPRIS